MPSIATTSLGRFGFLGGRKLCYPPAARTITAPDSASQNPTGPRELLAVPAADDVTMNPAPLSRVGATRSRKDRE